MTKCNTQEEIWKDVKGHEGIYQISNLGKVKSLTRILPNGSKRKGIVLKQCTGPSGYVVVCLSKDGKSKTKYIHRLVADAFVPNDESEKEVDHLDNNKLNNSSGNLEWVSRKENVRRSWDDGLMENQRKSAVKSGFARVKRVIKTDNRGNILGEYRSQTEAAKAVGVSPPSISMCCTGVRESAGGYYWKYAGETK